MVSDILTLFVAAALRRHVGQYRSTRDSPRDVARWRALVLAQRLRVAAMNLELQAGVVIEPECCAEQGGECEGCRRFRLVMALAQTSGAAATVYQAFASMLADAEPREFYATLLGIVAAAPPSLRVPLVPLLEAESLAPVKVELVRMMGREPAGGRMALIFENRRRLLTAHVERPPARWPSTEWFWLGYRELAQASTDTIIAIESIAPPLCCPGAAAVPAYRHICRGCLLVFGGFRIGRAAPVDLYYCPPSHDQGLPWGGVFTVRYGSGAPDYETCAEHRWDERSSESPYYSHLEIVRALVSAARSRGWKPYNSV